MLLLLLLLCSYSVDCCCMPVIRVVYMSLLLLFKFAFLLYVQQHNMKVSILSLSIIFSLSFTRSSFIHTYYVSYKLYQCISISFFPFLVYSCTFAYAYVCMHSCSLREMKEMHAILTEKTYACTGKFYYNKHIKMRSGRMWPLSLYLKKYWKVVWENFCTYMRMHAWVYACMHASSELYAEFFTLCVQRSFWFSHWFGSFRFKRFS